MNRQRALAVAGFLLVHLLASGPAGFAAGPEDARALMERSDAQTKSRTERTTYTMELLDPAGKVEQTRTLEVFYKRAPGREVTLQKFLAPPVLEDSGMMIVDTGAPTNDIWMYLPATRRMRRISGAEKSNWYMGTQFTFEDFEDYNLPAYRFTIREEAACGEGARCAVVEAEATADAEKKASGYGRKVYWIEKVSLYPVRVDYLDRQGRTVKRLTASGLEKTGDHWRPEEIVMHDLAGGRKTRIRVVKREIDAPLDDYYVSNRYLRKD